MKTKRKILNFLMLVGLCLGGFACEREQVMPEKLHDDATQLRLEVASLTQSYLANTSSSTLRGGPFLASLAADLKGALRGALDGYEISLGVHGPTVTVTGIGGAILGGVAASQSAAGLNPGSIGGNATPHPGNEFDHVGALHYTLMDEIYASPTTYFHPNGEVNYTAYHGFVLDALVARGILAETDRASFPMTAWAEKQPAFLGNESVLAFSNGLDHPLFLPTDRAILGQYFGALMASQDANAFAAYSIGVENAVVASSLPSNSKALLLIEMATARRGAAYWN